MRARTFGHVLGVGLFASCAGCGGGQSPVVEPPPSDGGTPHPDAGTGPRPPCTAPRAVAGEDVSPGERGFRPIPPGSAEQLVGKTVFAGSLEGPDGRVLVVTGEPLTLCDATAGGETARVMNNAGQEISVPLRTLSSTPLRLNLRAPPSGEELLLAATSEVDAIEAAAKSAGLAPAPEVVQGLDALVQQLVHGGKAQEELDRQGWLRGVTDPSILEWSRAGIGDAAKKARFEPMATCVAKKAASLASGSPAAGPATSCHTAAK